MGTDLKTIVGIFLLFGFVQISCAQSGCTRNCSACVSGQCLACESGFAFSEDGGCCSEGCVTDLNGFHLCDITTGECDYTNCYPGFVGPNCRSCPDEIYRCDICAERVTTTERKVDCIVCAEGYFPTENGSQCCQKGCNSCMGPNNRNCTTCRDSYYLYDTVCDTCGDYCQPPTNTTKPRCNPDNGECLYGCLDRWYGSKCNVICNETTARRCDVCTYDEPRNNLTCADCIDGFYGSYCEPCEFTCRVPGNDTNVCNQDGYCRYGCEDGYRGYKCNARCDSLPDLRNCLVCERDDMICTECKDGYWGNQCQFSCNENCVRHPTSDVPVCAVDNGKCDYGCIAQHYKDDCSGYCPNCGQDTCNRATGACDTPVCDPGFYGASCNFTCPNLCAPDPGNGLPYCDFNNGACSYGCMDGYWGTFCTKGCSVNCEFSSSRQEGGPKCFQENGTCLYQCKPGFYGRDCVDACKSQCVDNTCNIQEGTCSECSKPNPGYLCPFGTCQPFDTWGVFCEKKCPENCADGTCSRDEGKCSACKDGYYGDFCDVACPNCVNNKCYQTDGVCTDGCVNGWYTLYCTKRCLHEGCFNCERNDGQCLTCVTGLYGTNCSQECARTCSTNINGVLTCNRFSGECDAKQCRPGYYTPQCTTACSTYCQNTVCDIDTGTCDPCSLGWYGQKCDGECSDRCKNKDCIITKDNCRQGCTDGFWGSRCESNCNANCDRQSCDKNTAECLFGCKGNVFFGPTCSEPCNFNCVDNICNRTGYCERGCKTGWYGAQCKFQCDPVSRCNDGTCNRENGLCDACFTGVPDNRCPTAECPSGKRGNTCEESCTSDNCLYNLCGRYDDKCKGCPTGYHGNLCDKTCPNCKVGTGCEQDTGVCLEGCKDGWYTDTCNTQCSSVCGACERSSGDCVTCAPGRWGNKCEQICSSNCADTHGASSEFLIFCDKQTGACSKKACKVGFWREDCTQVCSSNCLPDENNNRVCAYLDGECSNGCKDTFYGSVCDKLCSPRCRDQLCTGFANTCDISCADGYYGATCDGTCSNHCAGNGKCDPSTGQCYEGCELGYYGARCDSPCKNTCVDSTCDDQGGCPDCKQSPVGPNCRVPVCNPGFYGPTCETNCPGQYCFENRCERITGICENGCLNNFYGAYCTENCQCDNQGTQKCEQTKGLCMCKPGRFGTLCDQTCSDGCFALECDRDGICSNGCNAGRYGPKCDKTCSNCFNLECGASTGTCLKGCVEGWYGPQCTNKCDEKCKTCDFETGACKSCADRFFGLPLCESTCSSNCESTGSGRTCSQSTGNCFNGCKVGYYGLKCPKACGRCLNNDPCDSESGLCRSCMNGWYGDTCENECNSRCATASGRENGGCRQSDGFCTIGCVPGFYSDNCELSCESTYCVGGRCDRNNGLCLEGCDPYHYGTNCENNCENCRSGACDQTTGYCLSGCLSGRYGDRCESTCLSLCRDNTCESSGYCIDCQLSPKGPNCLEQDPVTLRPEVEAAEPALSIGEIIGISAGCVAIVIIFVIIFVCCMIYKRRYDDAKTEIHLPSDVLDRLSTHRSLHSTVSTNYPVARVVGTEDEKDFVLF